MPLYTYVGDIAAAAGADSAMRTYHALRDRYYGRDSYDFGEPSLNIAAFRLARAGKFDEALALLKLNEEYFPKSSGMYVFRGNVLLLRADTNAAAEAFREAVRRDTTNNEAKAAAASDRAAVNGGGGRWAVGSSPRPDSLDGQNLSTKINGTGPRRTANCARQGARRRQSQE